MQDMQNKYGTFFDFHYQPKTKISYEMRNCHFDAKLNLT